MVSLYNTDNISKRNKNKGNNSPYFPTTNVTIEKWSNEGVKSN